VIGGNERATRRAVRDLDDLTPMQLALAELAYTLARALDEGAGAGMSTAAVAKELRATLEVLARSGDDGDSEVAQLIAELSAPVGDRKGPGPAHPG
jgi:hypothetical protein